MVFTLQRESTPIVNVIDDWLLVTLPCVSQLCYTNYMASAIEAIQEITLHLPPPINGLRGKVCIPVRCNYFEGSHELFYQSITFSASVAAGFDEIGDVLLGVTLFIELVEFGRLIAMGHAKSIIPLCIRLCIQVGLVRPSSQLSLDCICYQPLNLLNRH